MANAFIKIIYPVMELLGGVGVFIAGMMMMSDSIEKAASKGMRSMFKKISNNRWAGVGIGAGVTAIIQSSSATTVMTIGLVNAGILTLFQATSIIMGANIGTTVTGILVALSSFNKNAFQLKYFFMLMAIIGALMRMIAKRDNVKKIGDIILGFGLLFVGLEVTSNALSKNSSISGAFSSLFEKISFPLLLILAGAVFTAIIQSSSAATGIFITMVGAGILPLESAIYLTLGANIGTCITALIASFGANTNSKRAALIHFMFNIIGTIMFTAFLWPFARYILPHYKSIPFLGAPEAQLACFHLIFNVSTTLILVGFIKPLNKLACFIIREKHGDEDILRTSFIDQRLLNTPAIAIEQTLKEVNDMALRAKENLARAFNALVAQDLGEKDKILKEEARIDFLNQSLARYLVQISSSSISASDEKLVGGLHHVINDIERIGDHAENMFEDAVLMKEHNIVFSDSAVDELKNMYAKVAEMFELGLEIFNTRRTAKLRTISKLEQEVDDLKLTLADAHIKRLNEGICTFEGGEHFYLHIISLERVADHITNIAFSIRSYTGNETEAFRQIDNEKKEAAKAAASRKANSKL